MQKTPYVFPILGGRKPEQLYANIEALEITLTPEQITYLESVVPFDKGFPYTAFVSSLDTNLIICCRLPGTSSRAMDRIISGL